VTATTGLARANGVVWEVEGDVMMLGAVEEVKGRTRLMERDGVLARPGCVHARSGMFWASLDVYRVGQCLVLLGQR
jgi:hypothetical protein